MTPNEIKTIHELLMTRVQPTNAREGVAIAGLAAKLTQHFAQQFAPKDPEPVRPADPPSPA